MLVTNSGSTELAPAVDKCTQNCVFCWRVTPSDVNTNWDQISISEEDILGPEELLDATIMANLRTLGGYNPKAGAKVPEDRYQGWRAYALPIS
ncbi:MAG: hypothetical protein ACXABF_04185 [Candidatus Thorarchaeota archaeon]|jgi:wyosine [tRNA(Phe)-imidazoG37] synthetase (radical SAM superfamily)